MSTETTLLELVKPDGPDPFARSILNDNVDIIDKHAIIAFAFNDTPWPGLSKGALVKDVNNKPASQTIAGPNSLAGSMTWSFTATTITETLSITAPTAWSVVRTYTRSDKSQVCT